MSVLYFIRRSLVVVVLVVDSLVKHIMIANHCARFFGIVHPIGAYRRVCCHYFTIKEYCLKVKKYRILLVFDEED